MGRVWCHRVSGNDVARMTMLVRVSARVSRLACLDSGMTAIIRLAFADRSVKPVVERLSDRQWTRNRGNR